MVRVMAYPERILRVGVIGLGAMGELHVRTYCGFPDVTVVGVTDIDPDKLSKVESQYNAPGYRSIRELLEQPLDAVSVCVPTHLHCEVGLQVIERRIALLMEKPLARTVREGESLVSRARQDGVIIMVGHIERFNPVSRHIKALLKPDEAVSIQVNRVGPFPPRIRDVGVITDLGAHDIDLVRFICDSDFKHVFAVSSNNHGSHEDAAIIIAQMESGTLAQITTNWITPYKSREIRVATRDRYIEGNLITQQIKEYSGYSRPGPTYQVREWYPTYKEPIKEELTQFLSAVRGEQASPIPGEDGLYVLTVIERIISGIPPTHQSHRQPMTQTDGME